jgi:hypothetical protein
MKKNSRSYKKKGGSGDGIFGSNPGSYPDSVGTFGAVDAEANYGKMPNMFSSNQIGGMGYGFSNDDASLVPSVAGSYFPIKPTCSSAIDLARGGNNFIGGGKKLKGGIVLVGGRKRKGTKRSSTSKRSSTKKRSSTSKSKGKRSSTSKSSSTSKGSSTLKKWWQQGCNKLKGGFFVV